jgi:bifunctional non-homologous end joining protein LigD
MSLKTYQQKRSFARTPEPRGRVTAAKGRSFVVQKHAASHLHYDFRLEHGGVLWSWACPKGPSVDPAEKRLAVQVEDHPVDYGAFEGTIPEGQYGGGTVMLWDRGTWRCDDPDPEAAYQKGHLRFTLDGKKLHGGWHLVRMHGRESGGKPNWLLMKTKDKFARPGDADSLLERHAKSVKTSRTMDEIAGTQGQGRSAGRASGDSPSTKGSARATRAVSATAQTGRKSTKGNPNKTSRKKGSLVKATRTKRPRTKARANASRTATKSRTARKTKSDDSPGRPASLPREPEAQLATLVERPPEGPDWVHEMKFDGYRILTVVANGKARLVSRRGQNWTARMPEVAEVAASIRADSAVLDGEVVMLDEHGVSRFQLLQNAFGRKRAAASLRYYVFDLLYLDGHDVRSLPLIERKDLLRQILPRPAKNRAVVEWSDHATGKGQDFFREACRLGLEGIISKRVDAPYAPGRTGTWLKCKCHHEQEFVVAGYTDPQGARQGFGALLLGYYDRKELVYAGRVGTGFTDRTIRDLVPKLKQLVTAKTPFDRGARAASGKGVHWLRPELVAQIEFGDWTDDGLLRQPSFRGLRDDKPATKVKRERPRPR